MHIIRYLFIFLITFSFKGISQPLFFLDNKVAEIISAATFDFSKKQVLFFSGNELFFYPFGTEQTVQPQWYKLEGMATVDAAVSWDEKTALLFSGSSYKMFDIGSGTLAAEYTLWPGFPPEWNNQLDAAVRWDEQLIMFFLNNEFLLYNLKEQKYVDRNNIANWQGWPAHWVDGIDDAFNAGDGFIYFLRAGEMMPYSMEAKAFLSPRQITPVLSAQPAQGSNINPANLPPSGGSSSFLPPQNNVNSASIPAATNMNMQPVNVGSTDISGCFTGLPSGASGFREIQSPLVGDAAARASADNLPRGLQVAEVKIFTTKIWGKEVIAGIQTLLKLPSGELKEQPVLGRKTLSEFSFVLDEQECITGIQGMRNGPSGNFIYSLQIVTSKRTSQVYGNKMNEQGRESFSLMMPPEGIFNGFVGAFTTNMAGIGFKYIGQNTMDATAGNNTSQQMGASLSSALPINNPVNNNNQAGLAPSPEIPSGVQGEYADNYEDYTKQLGDAIWSIQPMPGLDWLGAGFDILRFDPLNPNETKNRKQFRAVVVTNSSERAGNKAQYLKPFGTNFGSVNSGSDLDSSSWVTSYQTFANSFAVSATGSVSIPGVASASQSGSYAEMNSTSVGSESIFYFTKIIRKIHEIDLLPTWLDQFTGQKFRQKLHPSFRADVEALPVLKGSIPQVGVAQMVKGKPLPSNIEQVKARYLQLIEKYGTHYASHVTWGGQYISRTEIKRADYEKSRMEKMAFMNSAEVSIKKVTVGRTVEVDNSYGSTTGTGKSVFRRQTYVQGGNGETDLDKWRDKVDLTPAPVQLYFLPYADLLNAAMFPGDKDIEAKAALLRMVTEKYLVDNMRPPVLGKDDFFRPLPDLEMPGNISVKNEGGYVAKFSVSFELNGARQTKESGSITLGRTLNVDVPVGATNIRLKVEYFTGWLDESKVIFEKTFTKPEVKCFKVWGTIFSQGHDECK